jgi:MFS family permease
VSSRPSAQDGGATGNGVWSGELRRLTAGIIALILLIAFEAMAAATAMPVAVRSLNGLAAYSWAFNGFLVASLLAMVVSGEVCDQSGPRRPVVVGVALFIAGLVVAGLATSMPVFVLGRAVQGLGGGAVIVAVYVVVGRSYGPDLRPRVFAAMSAAWVLPSIVGPVVAGAVADHLTWRLVFLGVPVLVLPAAWLLLPRLPRQRADDGTGSPPRTGHKRAAVAAAVGVTALQEAGHRLDWVGAVLAVAGLALLVPALRRLLPQGTVRFAAGLPATIGMRGLLAGAFFGAEAFVPLMLVSERGLSTTQAGLSLTSGALGWAAGSWFQGHAGSEWPRYRLVRLGCLAVSLGVGAVTLVLTPVVPPGLTAVAWVVGGLGMGVAMASVSVLLLELSPPQEQGANSAALQLSDALGGVLTIGFAGSVYAYVHAQPGPDTAAFAMIFVSMAGLALAGSLLAARLRPTHRATPTGAAVGGSAS